MSGGSFNYLYAKRAAELLDGPGQLVAMAAALKGLGYASEVAVDTIALHKALCEADKRLNARIESLAGVWRAMEWWRSGNRGEDAFEYALAQYRAGELPATSEDER